MERREFIIDLHSLGMKAYDDESTQTKSQNSRGKTYRSHGNPLVHHRTFCYFSSFFL